MAFDSLFTGVSGLDAYQSWIDMISNNIANTATVGFKDQRMTFADQFYQQINAPSGPTDTSGGIDPQDQGLGVKVNTIDTLFAQGGLQTTGVNTDLAINGDGFFILNNPTQSASPTYTRDGAFGLNSNGLLYDPGSGLAVQGYMANQEGQVTANGTPGDITIPIGLAEQATATGQGVKVGPALNDQEFDVSIGGNLDQTQWSQSFLNTVGASINPGTTKTISTTLYDSLGNAHQASITYTPYVPPTTSALGAKAATVTPGPLNGVLSVNPTIYTAQAFPPGVTQITATANAAGTQVTIADNAVPPNSTTATPGQTVTFEGVTFTIANPPTGGNTSTVAVTSASNGLPASVEDPNGVSHSVGACWQVSVSFSDGTQFATITAPGSQGAPPAAPTAPTLGQSSSGTIGYLYFDQNGQFINTSSIALAAGQNLGANDAAYLHSAGGGQPNILQGNQLNIVQWGPGAGNPASAPTAGQPAPAAGPIAIDFADNASLAGSYTANVISQNGYAAGTLSNITVGNDGTVTGSFTNGQSKTLAQLALATFQNEQGLQRIGSNQFSETPASGLAQIGTADNGRYGQIVAGALEQSNVNLADQFTNLIIAQRAFQANSRGIETADANLQTVIALQASQN
jgi:flagellar hook protein FlgE